MKFSDSKIEIAQLSDVPALKILLDRSYRGDEAKKGWTHEAFLIDGNVRASEKNVRDTMLQEGSVFLKYMLDGNITGCVNLQKHENKLYLGMFGVLPDFQGAGIGKTLLHAAEQYAKEVNCSSIYMSVISIRNDLIAWYQKQGYRDTGERKEFHEDGIHGKHLQQLEFMMLEKKL